MRTPRTIPNGWIRAEPKSDTVDSIRPGDNEKWTVPNESKPQIFIQLVADDEEPIPVGKVDINGNVEKFTVYYKAKNDDEEFMPFTLKKNDEPKVFVFLL